MRIQFWYLLMIRVDDKLFLKTKIQQNQCASQMNIWVIIWNEFASLHIENTLNGIMQNFAWLFIRYRNGFLGKVTVNWIDQPLLCVCDNTKQTKFGFCKLDDNFTGHWTLYSKFIHISLYGQMITLWCLLHFVSL